VKSIRSLVSTMAAVLRSDVGPARWCEVAYAGPAAAETFRSIFPEATFLCLHRSLQAVFADAVRAYPRGLGGSPFWSHTVEHPSNYVATIAEYWAAYTEHLLGFEDRHPQSTLLVRYEDLAHHPERVMGAVYEFLGVDADVPSAPGILPRAPHEEGQEMVVAAAQLARLPGQLHAKISDLLSRLNYPPLPTGAG